MDSILASESIICRVSVVCLLSVCRKTPLFLLEGKKIGLLSGDFSPKWSFNAFISSFKLLVSVSFARIPSFSS